MTWQLSFRSEPIAPETHRAGFAPVIVAAGAEPVVAAPPQNGRMLRNGELGATFVEKLQTTTIALLSSALSLRPGLPKNEDPSSPNERSSTRIYQELEFTPGLKGES
jgi:hypothetical protein